MGNMTENFQVKHLQRNVNLISFFAGMLKQKQI